MTHTHTTDAARLAGSKLDPQLERVLTAAVDAGRVPASAGTPAQARAQLATRAAAGAPGPAVRDVGDTVAPAATGTVPVRVYTPADATGTVVYLHGGGWVLGDLECFDTVSRQVAVAAGARVVSVDYRLAPENPYPAAVHDAWAALCWAAVRFGEPLALVGDSSGGNLAAVCAHRARARGHPAVTVQVLAYPVLDADLTRASYRAHDRADYLLNRTEMAWFWDQYLPDPGNRGDPEAAPLRQPDLAGLPTTVLLIPEHDPVRDECFAYADRLRLAGSPVEVWHYPTMAHGFLGLLGAVETAEHAWAAIGAHLRGAFHPSAASDRFRSTDGHDRRHPRSKDPGT